MDPIEQIQEKKPHRILMVASGETIHSIRPLKWLLEAGYEVLFFDFVDPLKDSALSYSFVRMRRVRILQRLCRLIDVRLGAMVVRWANRKNLRYILEEWQPDQVHIHYVDMRAIAIGRLCKQPLLLSVWGTDLNNLLKRSTRKTLESYRPLYNQASKILVDSEDMRSAAVKLSGSEETVVKKHLGVDFSFYQSRCRNEEWRRRLNADHDHLIVYSPRLWTNFYGHHLIAEAIGKAQKRLPGKKLLVVWKTAPGWPSAKSKKYLSEVNNALAKQNFSGQIREIGRVGFEELPGLFAAADLVVNFPLMDAFPVTLLETAVCQVPVVTILHDAYRGTYVEKCYAFIEQYNVDVLAAEIVSEIEKIGTDDQKCRLSLAKEEVEKHYNQEVYRKKFLEICRQLSIQRCEVR